MFGIYHNGFDAIHELDYAKTNAAVGDIFLSLAFGCPINLTAPAVLDSRPLNSAFSPILNQINKYKTLLMRKKFAPLRVSITPQRICDINERNIVYKIADAFISGKAQTGQEIQTKEDFANAPSSKFWFLKEGKISSYVQYQEFIREIRNNNKIIEDLVDVDFIQTSNLFNEYANNNPYVMYETGPEKYSFKEILMSDLNKYKKYLDFESNENIGSSEELNDFIHIINSENWSTRNQVYAGFQERGKDDRDFFNKTINPILQVAYNRWASSLHMSQSLILKESTDLFNQENQKEFFKQSLHAFNAGSSVRIQPVDKCGNDSNFTSISYVLPWDDLFLTIANNIDWQDSIDKIKMAVNHGDHNRYIDSINQHSDFLATTFSGNIRFILNNEDRNTSKLNEGFLLNNVLNISDICKPAISAGVAAISNTYGDFGTAVMAAAGGQVAMQVIDQGVATLCRDNHFLKKSADAVSVYGYQLEKRLIDNPDESFRLRTH